MSAPAPLLQPGGFDRHRGQLTTPQERLRRLTLLFWNDFFARNQARVAVVSVSLTVLGFAVWIVVRARVAMFAIEPGQQAGFVLGLLANAFSGCTACLLWHTAARVSPLLAKDAHEGALLLYLTRPLQRDQLLLARLLAASAGNAVLLAGPMAVLTLVAASQLGLSVDGVAWPSWTGPLWWLAVLVAALLASAVAALVATVTGLATGLAVRRPSATPLAFGGLVLGSIAASWVLQLAGGRDGLGRAVDLHHALEAPWTLLTWWLEPQRPPRPLLLQALAGLGLWAALAAGSWTLLRRFIAQPPLGKGRSG